MHPFSIYCKNTCLLEKYMFKDIHLSKSIPRGSFFSSHEILFIWNCKQLEPISGNVLQNLTSLGMMIKNRIDD